ncbi:MAG: HAD family phosphatase [Actinomycetota bacterium]|nr:HAD family phosphatase [Actinomycetota bacterium]
MTAAYHGRPAAVLFDLDGLLVDSEPVWSVAEAEIMDWLGGPWNPAVKAACLGRRIDASCRELVRLAGSTVAPAEVQERLLARMAELFRAELPWRPGARELLDALAAAGVPLALVSSSYRVLVDAALEGLGASRFAVTLAGDEVTSPKPDPEPYLRAARGLGVSPADCVVFEDSPTGVASAEAAGCVCVAVPDVVPVEAMPRRPVLASLAEADLGWLAALPYRRTPTSAA